MKNLFILTVLGLLVLISCKKDYICECTASYNGVPLEVVYQDTIINDYKAKARVECDALENVAATFVDSASVDCEIK